MKYQIFKSDHAKTKDFGNLQVNNLFNSPEFEYVSIVKIFVEGKNQKVMDTKSNKFYYVIEGDGYFTIENEKHPVSCGDLIFIPKGTTYFDEGNMVMLAINSPRFNRENVKYIE